MSNESPQLETSNNLETNKSMTNYTSSKLSTSKIHQFENNFPEPRNATEGTVMFLFITLYYYWQLTLFFEKLLKTINIVFFFI